jgi:NAD-dependent deacetylase
MPDDPDGSIEAAAETLREADHTVVLTGAGVSVASGVPTFRGDDGLWNRHDESDIHIRRFRSEPAAFWDDWLAFHDDAAIEAVEPNPAHNALAALESAGQLEAVLTQNVDGLHQQAGSQTVIELHGTHATVVCSDCDGRFDAEPVYERVRAGDCPPTCEDCGSILKPGSVLFGEALPRVPLQRAQRHVRECDCMLVVGSSLAVEPVGSMPRRAARTGATLMVVDPEGTPVDDQAAQVLHEPATAAIPAIRDALLDAIR